MASWKNHISSKNGNHYQLISSVTKWLLGVEKRKGDVTQWLHLLEHVVGIKFTVSVYLQKKRYIWSIWTLNIFALKLFKNVSQIPSVRLCYKPVVACVYLRGHLWKEVSHGRLYTRRFVVISSSCWETAMWTTDLANAVVEKSWFVHEFLIRNVRLCRVGNV